MERLIALEILNDVLMNGEYASLAMKKRLNDLDVKRRPFVTELVNGVLRKLYLLEYQYSEYINSKTKMRLKLILDLAIYERFFLNKQDYVVNEYINIATNKNDKAFINALMHKINALKIPDLNSDEGKSIYYSLPLWLLKMFKAQYDEDIFNFILNDINNRPNVFYRLNHKKCSFKDLEALDIEILNEDSFISKNNLLNTEHFKKGYFYIEDFNAAKIVKELDLKEDNIFLDLCAAPGSKFFNSLDYLKEENAYANDINRSRLNLIKEKAKLLGFNNISLTLEDASLYDNEVLYKADKILLDVPCSGLGVLKRKPEIRYRLKDTDIDNLINIQKKILTNVLSKAKSGAIILYSTCTLNTKENSRLIKQVLKDFEGVEVLNEVLYLDNPNADRFYSAKLLKRN